jgi:hypothetical protein
MRPKQHDPKHGPQARREAHRDRLEQAANARREQLQQHALRLAERAAKEQAEKQAKESRPARDGPNYRSALSTIPFWVSG